MARVPPPLAAGTLLAGRFELGSEIGSGANSHVYWAKDQRHNDRLVAVKIEQVLPANRPLLQTEAEVLHALRGSGGIPQMVAFVDKTAGGSLLAMELLGEDVRRVSVQARRFSAAAISFLGTQMLAALQGVHERGLVHRDVKPGNFAFGRKQEEDLKVYLIDFGLVRRHLENDGTARRARSRTPFRGTTHYASMAAMLGKDLGRVDDLWSLAFSLLEMCVGSLPWDKLYQKGLPREQKERAKRQVLDEKKRLVSAVGHGDPQAIEALRPSARFLRHVPRQLQDFIRALMPLRYDSKPDYKQLHNLLLEAGNGEAGREAAEQEIRTARNRAIARRARQMGGQGAEAPPQEEAVATPAPQAEVPAAVEQPVSPGAAAAGDQATADGQQKAVDGSPKPETKAGAEVQQGDLGEVQQLRTPNPVDEEQEGEPEPEQAEEQGDSVVSADDSAAASGEDTKDEGEDYEDEDGENAHDEKMRTSRVPRRAHAVQTAAQAPAPATAEQSVVPAEVKSEPQAPTQAAPAVEDSVPVQEEGQGQPEGAAADVAAPPADTSAAPAKQEETGTQVDTPGDTNNIDAEAAPANRKRPAEAEVPAKADTMHEARELDSIPWEPDGDAQPAETQEAAGDAAAVAPAEANEAALPEPEPMQEDPPPPQHLAQSPGQALRVLRIVRRPDATPEPTEDVPAPPPARPPPPSRPVTRSLDATTRAAEEAASRPVTRSCDERERAPPPVPVAPPAPQVMPRKRPLQYMLPHAALDVVGFICGDEEGGGRPYRLLRARLAFADEEPREPMGLPWQRVGVGARRVALMAFLDKQPPLARPSDRVQGG